MVTCYPRWGVRCWKIKLPCSKHASHSFVEPSVFLSNVAISHAAKENGVTLILVLRALCLINNKTHAIK